MNTTVENQKDIYLSIVVSSRNDNHGGDMLERMSTFMNSVFVLAERKQFLVELIIVEWNPPQDRPLLHEDLPKPMSGFVQLRYIVVSKEIHDTYRNAEAIPLYQMIAKNVGIRRAKGKFVLCTNIDIIFSEENFDFLAQKRLRENYYYRANRVDVYKEVMKKNGLDNQISYCNQPQNIIKRLGKVQNMEILSLPSFVYRFPTIAKLLDKFVLWGWKITHKGQFPHFLLDMDACGDYTLMSKKDWERMQGYVELDMYSIHIDSMGIWSANAIGMKQYILPYKAPIYHIDHEDGWESKDALRTIKFLENKPCLDYTIIHKAGLQIVAQGTSWGINKDNWGLIDKDLQEFAF